MEAVLEHVMDLGADEDLALLVGGVIEKVAIPIEGIKFGISNGSSCVIVPADGSLVYQVYKSSATFARIAEFCLTAAAACRFPDSPAGCGHLVPPAGHYPELNCMVFRKIVPLNATFPVMIAGGDHTTLREFVTAQEDRIIHEIGSAIAFIESIGYSHGDVVLDNIGVDPGAGNRFVLFDYDRTSKAPDFARDRGSLNRSIKYWKEHA